MAADAVDLDRLSAELYGQLRRLARSRLSGGGRHLMLDTTSLVHESFLRLQGAGRLRLEDRNHFLAYAATAMRSVVIDYVRKRHSDKRGGGAEHVTLVDVPVGDPDEGLEVIRRLWSEDKVDFEGVHYHLSGASIAPKPVQPDLPIWIGGSSEAAIRRTARIGTGWQAGPETPEQAAKVVAAIKAACAQEGRTIDDDHYGAGIPYRFGSPDDPALLPLFEAYRKRTGRDPRDYFAVGDAEAIVGKIADYVEAGVSKFILRPSARGDDEIMTQTRRLIEEVLPRVASRWPKPAKRRVAQAAE